MHLHENEPPSLEQIPSFLQGEESQGLGFSSRKKNKLGDITTLYGVDEKR